MSKLEGRLRRSADRRRVHYGRHSPTSLSDATGNGTTAAEAVVSDADDVSAGRVVREKQHPDTPMTVDEALENMELVGHDFYLFMCAETLQPTVVYRRHGYDYGLIRLTAPPQPTDQAALLFDADAVHQGTEPEPASVR